MKILFFVLLILMGGKPYCQDYNVIKQTLEEINELDQKYRVIIDSLLRKKRLDWNHPEIQNLIPAAAKQDSVNLIKVLALIDKYGWLGVNKIGKKANETQFLIVQHADTNVILQYFPLLTKFYELGESPGKFYAMMLDRILVERNQKQVFGTQIQMRKENGEFVLYSIAAEFFVDKRRKKLGLTSIKSFKASLNR